MNQVVYVGIDCTNLMKPKQRETHQRHKKDSELIDVRNTRTDSYSRLETACGTFS